MSKISETPRWENEIHALTRGEKVEGGRGGAANIQASQLGNRTAFLKNELDALGTLIKSGDMPFASEEAAAAAINEGKSPMVPCSLYAHPIRVFGLLSIKMSEANRLRRDV